MQFRLSRSATAESERSKGPIRADMAVRAPADCRFMAAMRDFKIMAAPHEPAGRLLGTVGRLLYRGGGHSVP